jgi:hypothetical protein
MRERLDRLLKMAFSKAAGNQDAEARTLQYVEAD